MAITLTRRQQEFLIQFRDFFHDLGEPVHYVSLAESLGIGKVTAYEMLRVLEERGMVSAEYQLPGESRGPGRSTVLFSPTSEAIRFISGKLEENLEAWEAAKNTILEKLLAGRETGYEDLLDELITMIPERQSLMVYLTEMVTATMLSLKKLHDDNGNSDFLQSVQRIGLKDEIDLNSLPGMNAILVMIEHANQQASEFLQAQGGKFQSKLAQVSEENQQRLCDFTREIAKLLKG